VLLSIVSLSDKHAGLAVQVLQCHHVIHAVDDVLLQDGIDQAGVGHEPLEVCWIAAEFIFDSSQNKGLQVLQEEDGQVTAGVCVCVRVCAFSIIWRSSSGLPQAACSLINCSRVSTAA
jgi:hypothetical protein